MKYYLTLFWVGLLSTGMAQTFRANTTSEGIIKTTKGKLTGQIDVIQERDQVLWKKGNEIQILGAQEIKEAHVTHSDGTEDIYMGFNLNGDAYLFHLIVDGKVKILHRPGIIKNSYTNEMYPEFFTISKNEIVPLYKRKDFLDMFGNDEKWMSVYIKNNNLDIEQMDGIVTAFSYYNDTSL